MPDAIPRPPDISVPVVKGLARLVVAVAWGVRRLGDRLVQSDAPA